MSYQFKKDLWYEVTQMGIENGLFANRLYPGIAPQKATYPFLVFNTVSANDDLCHDGPVGIIRERVQFDILGDTPDICEIIRDDLYTLLHGTTGAIGSGGATTITFAQFDNEIDFSEWEEGKHRKTVDFIISYK